MYRIADLNNYEIFLNKIFDFVAISLALWRKSGLLAEALDWDSAVHQG